MTVRTQDFEAALASIFTGLTEQAETAQSLAAACDDGRPGEASLRMAALDLAHALRFAQLGPLGRTFFAARKALDFVEQAANQGLCKRCEVEDALEEEDFCEDCKGAVAKDATGCGCTPQKRCEDCERDRREDVALEARYGD